MNGTAPDILDCLANLSSDEVFTPPALVGRMLDLLPKSLWRNPHARFLDPFSKSGVFLREIARRLDVGLESQIPDREERVRHILSQQVYGIAITRLTALFSRRTLYCNKDARSEKSNCFGLFRSEGGNIAYRPCRHDWANGSCRLCGASEKAWGATSRSKDVENYAYPFLHDERLFMDSQELGFDVVIGNPPYHAEDGGNSASAKPIYPFFVEQAKKLNPRYLCMVIPARWYTGGKGLDSFRDTKLTDNRIKTIRDYVNSKDLFPELSVSGGICYFLWDRDYHGDCAFSTTNTGVTSMTTRRLDEFPVLVRYNEAINIIHRVQKVGESSIATIMTSRNPYGLPTNARGETSKFTNSIKLVSSQGEGFINQTEVISNRDSAASYKVMITRIMREHAGEPDRTGQFGVLSTIRVLAPGEVCTDSYITGGKFRTRREAEHLAGYLRTKFSRFLLLQAAASINLTKTTYQFVPIQDFSKPWTDEELYAKYGLSEKEIAFIEAMIRPMEA